MAEAPHASASPQWVSIGRASQMLGVNASTLRQWTSAGKVHVYRTPGGHRRFSTTELAQMREISEGTPSRAAVQSIIAKLRARYRGVAQAPSVRSHWLEGLSEDARTRFHGLGDRLLEQLQEYLSAAAPRAKSRSLGLAREIAADYGRLAHEVGLGAPEAVEAYVLFRRPLLELLSRNVADHPELSGEFGRIIRDSERFMDQVLAELTGAQSAEAKHAAR